MGTYGKMYSKLQELIKRGMNLDDAANQVLREYEGRGPAPTVVRNVGQRQTRVVEPNPTGRQLQRTLNEILPPIQDTAQQMGNTYRSTLTHRQMERRYQYSKRCRNVMMKIIKEDIQRYQKFLDTAKNLFGENPYDQNVPQGQKPPTVNMGRWMQQLMRMDGSEEARYHNEEVVSLAMLCESATYKNLQAGRQKFRAARYKHYTENLHQTEEEANRHADEDLNKGAKRLAELTLDMLSRQCCTPEEADQALDAILTGSAERNGPDGLERAYRTIMSPANAVSWNISNTRNDLNRYGAGISEEEYRRRYHPFEMKSVASHGAVAALVANPYYAVLDSGKLADALATQLQCREGENNHNSPLVDFGADATGGMMGMQMDYQNRNLTRFNFTRGNVTQLWQQPEYVSVYTSGNRSLILVGKPRNLDQGLSTSFEWNKPGRLINGNFAKIVSDMKAAVEKKDQFLRSSPEYRAMKRALNDVSKVKIPDSGDDAKLRELGRKLETLRAAANAYIEKKNREFEERGAPRGQNGKNPYERQRYAAAASMGGFIDEMENRITHIRRHQSTVTRTFEQERLAAEMRAEQQNAQQVQQAPQAEQNLQPDAPQNDAPQNDALQNDAPQNEVPQNNVPQNAPMEEEEEEIRLDPPKDVRIGEEEYERGKKEKKGPEKREEDKKEEDQKEENHNRINEAEPKPKPELEPIDPDEAESVRDGVGREISNAYWQTGFDKWVWAQEDYAPGKFDASNAHLDDEIGTNIHRYLQLDPGDKYSARDALSHSVLKYMLNHAEHGQVLDFAFEYGQLSPLYTEILISKSFQEQFDKVDWNNLAEGKACLTDENRIIKPLGDKLLRMINDVLEKEAPKVAKEKPKRAYTWAETRRNRQLERSEKALEQGNTEEAVKLGIDAVALQTVSGLVKSTAGMAGNPYALQRMVHKSEYFKAEIAKFDFSKPGALREAMDAKVGTRIADTLLEKQKQKGRPVDNSQPNNKQSVRNEQKQQKVIG